MSKRSNVAYTQFAAILLDIRSTQPQSGVFVMRSMFYGALATLMRSASISVLLCTIACFVNLANASHFMGGTVHAERVAQVDPLVDNVTVRFQLTWRAYGAPFNPFVSYPQVGTTYDTGETIEYAFTNGVSGSLAAPLTVISVNRAQNIAVTETVLTIPGGKELATLSFSGCCRGGEIADGNGYANYAIKMDVPALQGNQTWRSARVATLPVMYQLVGSPGSFGLDMTRPEGLTLKAGVAPTANSGLVAPRPVGTPACQVGGSAYPCTQCVADPLTGVCTDAMHVFANGATTWVPQLEGSYAVQFDVARYDASQVRKDSVPFDMLVKVVPPCTASPPTCLPAPAITVVPTYLAAAGTPLSIPVTVNEAFTPASLSLSYSPLPAGMTITSNQGSAPQLVTTLNWTPAFVNAGTYEICFQAYASVFNYFDGTTTANSYGRPCVIITVPGPKVPDAPTMYRATTFDPFTQQHITRVYYAPSAYDGGAAIKGYTVVSNPPGGIDARAGMPYSNPRPITGLTNGVQYSFTVFATNSVGNSEPSASSNIVMPLAAPLPPVITSVTPGDARLIVNVIENPAPGSNGGSPVTAISVGVAGGGGVDSSPGSLQPEHVVVGLDNGTPYVAAAIAYNQLGGSNPTLYSVGVPPGPAKPTIVKAFATSPIVIGQTSLLTITVTNPNPVSTLDGLAFTDSLPAGITASAGSLSLCGGTITVTASSVALANGSIAANSNCVIAINVTGVQARVAAWTNTISNLSTTTTTLAGTTSTTSASITVGKAATSTAITSTTPAISIIAQSYLVNYAVTVTAPGAGAPTGTVTVSDGSNSCIATLPATSCSLPSPAAGVATLTATYSSDARFIGSVSAPATHTISKAATSSSIVSIAPASTLIDQSYLVTYAVAVIAPGVGTPTGTVTVSDGTNSCVGTLPAVSCTMPSTVAGTATLTATYNGDGQFASSASAPATHAVSKISTSTLINTALPASTVVGQPYVVTYTVAATTSSVRTLTGTVTVSDGTDSCIGTLPAFSCTMSSSTAGNASLSATYAGDANFSGSASSAFTQTIAKAATTTVIVSDTPDPSTAGTPVRVTAVVAVVAPGAGTPTGSVSVSDGVTTCTITLPATACDWTPSTVGARTLTASYGGDAKFSISVSANAAHTVVATGQENALTVSKLGSGAGTVSSDVAGITCGAACAHTYANGSAVTLTATPDSGSAFAGWLGACADKTPCALTINSPVNVSATFAPSLPLLSIDIDGNGTADALTDGLLMMRYLSALTGAALTSGATGGGTLLRSTPVDLLQYLANVRPMMDVDGNGQVDASTDGLMLLRYLFGLRGDALISGAVGVGARRTTAAQIENHIASQLPQ